MPRDLAALARDEASSNTLARDEAASSPLELERIHAQDEPSNADRDTQSSNDKPDNPNMFGAQAQQNSKRDDVHPYTQTLTLSDVESCVILEEAAFPPQERATREKFQYRLGKCSELSLGIFTSHQGDDGEVPTFATAAPVYSGAPHRRQVLLGHIVATKTNGLTVSDADMGLPSDDPSNPDLGNKHEGRTVAIHSLAVLPAFQGKGLGTTLMKAYLDRLAKQDVADKAALIAHEDMIPYYEKFGFKNRGKSAAQFGGGGWFDMVKDISVEEDSDY